MPSIGTTELIIILCLCILLIAATVGFIAFFVLRRPSGEGDETGLDTDE